MGVDMEYIVLDTKHNSFYLDLTSCYGISKEQVPDAIDFFLTEGTKITDIAVYELGKHHEIKVSI